LGEAFPGLAGFGPGSVLAGYQLEAQVGAGGMAVVFRARDQRLDRLVALKILAPAQAADRELRHRFIAESRAAAAVDDPHIIPVYEAGEAGGVLFIAMRFIQGGDLWQVLSRERPLPPDRAAAFISPVASALDAAHRAGLVHRDVKPGNILVDARPDRPDHVYLSDFGISKRAVSSVGPTAAGQWVGTVDYAAPEQIQGQAVDGRADQYALACVAYLLLTGTVPFKRDQDIAVVYAHLSEPPPSLAGRRPGLPAAADEVMAKAMAKIPDKRYGSCREFADALRHALGLPPYISRGSAASGHPPFMVAVNQAAVGPRAADQSSAATLGTPGTAPAGAATAPPAVAVRTGSGRREATQGLRGADAPADAARRLTGNPGMTAESGGLTAGPSRPIADSNRSSDGWNALAANPERATLSRAGPGHRAQPRRSWRWSGSGGHRRWRIVTAALLVLVALVVVGGYLFVQSTQGQYYLTASNGQIVIYQGVNQQILWYKLYHVYQQTGIKLAQVPTNDQQAVSSYPPSDLAHAQSSVANIRAAVNLCYQQYTQLRDWVIQDNRYVAELAAATRQRKPTTGIAKPGPAPAVGPFCQPSEAFGIPASDLSPTPAGRS
jgi:tRNA A-37 threonylcarbamoyl transferase component Bud32